MGGGRGGGLEWGLTSCIDQNKVRAEERVVAVVEMWQTATARVVDGWWGGSYGGDWQVGREGT